MGLRRFRRLPPDLAPAEQALVRARRLIRTGRYAQAGVILAQLAREAEALGRPKVAAELHARAAHCFVDGGAEAAGLAEAQAALRVFTNLNLAERRVRFLGNICRKLQAHGMAGAVGALRTEFDGMDPTHPAAVTPLPTLRLPPACPQCGAPLRGDEVEWVDVYSAECNYCGAVVQGKEN